jgi:hypothetical protein
MWRFILTSVSRIFWPPMDNQVIETRPRFLPLTIKSRLPVHPALIAAYLKSPIKPLAKQMSLRARAA